MVRGGRRSGVADLCPHSTISQSRATVLNGQQIIMFWVLKRVFFKHFPWRNPSPWKRKRYIYIYTYVYVIYYTYICIYVYIHYIYIKTVVSARRLLHYFQSSDKGLAILSMYIYKFFLYFKLVMYEIPLFPSQPMTLFCGNTRFRGTLFEKHCIKQ
jgi:hypothetical protein